MAHLYGWQLMPVVGYASGWLPQLVHLTTTPTMTLGVALDFFLWWLGSNIEHPKIECSKTIRQKL